MLSPVFPTIVYFYILFDVDIVPSLCTPSVSCAISLFCRSSMLYFGFHVCSFYFSFYFLSILFCVTPENKGLLLHLHILNQFHFMFQYEPLVYLVHFLSSWDVVLYMSFLLKWILIIQIFRYYYIVYMICLKNIFCLLFLLFDRCVYIVPLTALILKAHIQSDIGLKRFIFSYKVSSIRKLIPNLRLLFPIASRQRFSYI